MNTISNQEDVIDSRDVIARIEDLESERAAVEEDAEAIAEWDAGADGEELKTLKTLADQCEGYGDWGYGETLIRESYFRDYAMQLADDLGAVPDNVGWPLTCIDWERAVRELRMDYTEVDYDGVSYFIRA